MNNRGDIVVGYDGSKTASLAVEFAAAQASLQDARLRIVSVWNSSPPAGVIPAVGLPGLAESRAHLAAERLEQATRIARLVAPQVEIDIQGIEGSAGPILVEVTRNSRLLVVGCRGHSGVQGLLLGSVSHHCTLHATCPVLVIPAHVDDRPPPSG
jgi:nucleotide-binding universal stress UspA family protein